jgi:EpsI family protein
MRLTPSIRALVVAAAMLGTALFLSKASRAEVVPPRAALATMPMRLGDWNGRRDPDLTADVLAVAGVDDYLTRTYFRPDGAIANLYIGYYYSQRQGDTIHSPLNCLPGSGWQPIEQGRRTIPVRTAPNAIDTVPIEVNRVVIGRGLERQLVIYWYQSHRRVVASEYMGKVYTVLDAVRYNRTDAALVRVVAPLRDDLAVAAVEPATESFIQTLFPSLGQYLPHW